MGLGGWPILSESGLTRLPHPYPPGARRLAVFETWDQAMSGSGSSARPVTFISNTLASLTRTGPDSP
jgi:hypothetical protein